MQCPTCNSTHISRPRYGAIPGGRRLTGVATCLNCRQVIYQKAGR